MGKQPRGIDRVRSGLIAVMATLVVAAGLAIVPVVAVSLSPDRAAAGPIDGIWRTNTMWNYGPSVNNDPSHIVYAGAGPIYLGAVTPIWTTFVTDNVRADFTPAYARARYVTSSITVTGLPGVDTSDHTLLCNRPDPETGMCRADDDAYTVTLFWTATVESGACVWDQEYGNPRRTEPCPRSEISGTATRTVLGQNRPGTPTGFTPEADFSWETTDLDQNEITFTNDSSDPEDGDDLDYTWDFGDGTTSDDMDPVHRFPAKGAYAVTLEAEDADGNVGTITEQVVVGNGLTAALFNPATNGATKVREGEFLDLRLRARDVGPDDLHDVRVKEISAPATDDDGEGTATIVSKPGGATLSGTLTSRAPGDQDFADFRVTGTAAGAVRITVVVEATTPDGDAITATATFDLRIEPASLLVELTARVRGVNPSPPPGRTLEFLLNENDHDNRFEIEVKVTNRGEEPIESIDFLDPAAPIDLDTLRTDPAGNPIPGIAIEPLDDPAPDLPDDDLDPGESTSQVYAFEGFDKAHAMASALVEGRMNDQAITGRGTVEVKVLTDVLVEFGMRESRPGTSRGGAPIRLDGVLRNISEDSLVGVAVFPETEGNAGNGNVFPTSAAGSATPDTPLGFVLAPDDQVDLQALLITTELAVASQAEVSWKVLVWIHETDPETGELTKVPAADTQIRILDDDYSSQISVRLPPADRLPDVVGECAWAYFGCGVLVGIDRLAESLFDLTRLGGQLLVDFGNQELRLIAWLSQMHRDIIRSFLLDTEAMKRLADEVLLDMVALVDAGLYTAQQLADVSMNLTTAIADGMRRWERMYETGNLEQITYEFGVISGENPDLALSTLAFAKATVKSIKLVSRSDSLARKALATERAAHTEKLGERLAEAQRTAAAGGTPVSEAKVFASGDQLSVHAQGDYFGADPRDVATLGEVARAHQASITYGAKVSDTLAKIRSGQAWAKPSELAIQPVTQLDVDFLGYPQHRVGYSDLATPPPEITDLLGTGFGDCCFHPGKARLERAAGNWVAKNHPNLDAAQAQRIATHLERRTEEFIVNYERYVHEAASPLSEGKIAVGWMLPTFNPGDFYEAGWKVVVDERRIRLEMIDHGEFSTGADALRNYWEITFDATGHNDFRPVTGGVEILSVQNLDGTKITDEVKRAAVYRDLEGALSMQNGSLHDFVAGGSDEVLSRYAREQQTAVTIGPDGKGWASYYEPKGSIQPGGPNAARASADLVDDFVMVTGLPQSWRARAAGIGTARVKTLFELLSASYSLPLFFLPVSLYKFVQGMTSGQTRNAFDRDGSNVRADGEGGLEAYDPDGTGKSPTKLRATSTATATATAAGTTTGGWTPISLADALALGGDPEVLELSPQTIVQVGSGGSTTLEVASAGELFLDGDTEWFRPGDAIVIDPGGPNEEFATVAALGSLVLTAPLTRDHQPGEMVVRAIPLDEGRENPGTTTTTTAPGTTAPTTSASSPGVPEKATGDGASARGSIAYTGSSAANFALLAVALVLVGTVVLGLRTRTRRRSRA